MAASASGRRFGLITNRRLPDGQDGSVRTLYLLRLGHGLRRINQFRTYGSLEIAISPRGDEIAFDKGAEIWTVDVDGTHEHQVTFGPGVASSPAYMPDGEGLVFVRSEHGTPEIFKTRFGGAEESPVTSGEGRVPAVARDGRIVYFASDPEQIVVMNADGSGRHAIHRNHSPILYTKPTFSPNGRSVAFLRLAEANGRRGSFRYSIHTVTATGRNPGLVLRGPRDDPPIFLPLGPLWVPAI
jgi:Tol biopolymer transport system component